MRCLLVVGFLLCSGACAAQTDDRRVRTVEIDEGAERAAQPDQRPGRSVQTDEGRGRAAQGDQRRKRTVPTDQGPQRVGLSNEHRDGAEHPDEHLVLARQLVDLGPDSGGHSESGANCVPQPETLRKDILAAYRANPAEFHGISPQSAYWPDVERAWNAYYVDRCAAQTDDAPAVIVARRYAANLSTDELREVLAFQESPSGRAFIAATRLARQDLESPPEAPTRRDTDDASTTFRQAMLRLKAMYERAPK